MRGPNGPWQEYRRRRNLVLFASVGSVPCVSVVAMLAQRLFQSWTPVSLAGIGWMIFFVVAVIRHESFRCPKCGECFFAKWWYHDAIARKCVHRGDEFCQRDVTDNIRGLP